MPGRWVKGKWPKSKGEDWEVIHNNSDPRKSPERTTLSQLYYHLLPWVSFLSEWHHHTPQYSSWKHGCHPSPPSFLPLQAWRVTKFHQLYLFNTSYVVSASLPSRLHCLSPAVTICSLAYSSGLYPCFQSFLQAVTPKDVETQVWSGCSPARATPLPWLSFLLPCLSNAHLLLSFLSQFVYLFLEENPLLLPFLKWPLPCLHPAVSRTCCFNTPVSCTLQIPSRDIFTYSVQHGQCGSVATY